MTSVPPSPSPTSGSPADTCFTAVTRDASRATTRSTRLQGGRCGRRWRIDPIPPTVSRTHSQTALPPARTAHKERPMAESPTRTRLPHRAAALLAGPLGAVLLAAGCAHGPAAGTAAALPAGTKVEQVHMEPMVVAA